MRHKNTSDEIRFHPTLGVYRTYKGFKYQPGNGYYTYIRPRGRNLYFVAADTFTQFKRLVDRKSL